MTTTALEFHRSTAVPSLEVRRSCRENSCYRPHTHDVLSIGLIDEGTSVFAGPLAGPVELTPGDIVVIPAGHVHSCNPGRGRWRYQMTHLDTGWMDGLAPGGLDTGGVRVLRSATLYRQMETVNDAIVADAPVGELEDGCRRLAQLLAHTGESSDEGSAQNQSGRSGANRDLSVRLQPVLEHLRHDETTPSIDALAHEVGMGRYQLIRAVKQVTGLSPLAWRQNARILEARRLLRTGMTIADTAVTLGFNDQSHFHRVFRAYVAATPGTYRH